MKRRLHELLRRMEGAVIGLLLLAMGMAPGLARGESPFGVAARVEALAPAPLLRVDVTIPPGHILYADHLEFATADEAPLDVIELPAPVEIKDPFSEEHKKVHQQSFSALLRLGGGAGRESVQLVVRLQGCDDKVCFFPEERTFDLALTGPATAAASEAATSAVSVPSATEWKAMRRDFEVKGQAVGYLGQEDFLAFLDRAQGAAGASSETGFKEWVRLFETDPVAFMKRFGVVWTVLLILLGGLLLNLTPCVLPMIPINLAVIGAGVRASSRRRGFLLGGVYGLAIALVYGVLGLVVVLSGSQFGALNSSPWFNLTITLIFVALALAMFDVFTIDFTRLQGLMGARRPGAQPGGMLVAFFMGGVSALLAGACVAPVVISVLVLAGNLFAHGWHASLLLPFLLGLGMALPWPFAGAGLSFLPKPGGWMVWVKYGFGIFILLLALYYGSLAYRGFRGTSGNASPAAAGEAAKSAELDRPGYPGLAEALQQARQEGKPVFIDFWATWCKNCEAMEKTTFRREAVAARLREFVVIKAQAERPGEAPAREVLEEFGVKGLPTYVILQPRP